MTGRPWLPELDKVFEDSLTAEYASLTRDGAPVTVPVTPHVEEGCDTIDVSTGLTYPAKAERARRDPRVALLFADPLGVGHHTAPVVLVQGLATVRDANLQANTDRYVRLSMKKIPAATERAPRFALRRTPWYFARIWIHVTSLHIKWWPSRDLDEEPSVWEAPEGTAAPLSDPAPSGSQPPGWLPAPREWRKTATTAIEKMELRDLTSLDSNGFPLCVPVAGCSLEPYGFRLAIGRGVPELNEGPACLTLHTHERVFRGQENRTFVGSLQRDDTGWRLNVQRVLAHWSLAGGSVRMSFGFLAKGRRLSPRLAHEAKRRSQPVPRVRFPEDG